MPRGLGGAGRGCAARRGAGVGGAAVVVVVPPIVPAVQEVAQPEASLSSR